jgi:heparan-alpha-glucosaminide N-acetyltransferase
MADPTDPAKGRLLSLDAYRGFIMLAMASGGLGLARVARQSAGGPVWQALAYQVDHVPWRGCSFWDLIQPSFLFMVGVALPFSDAARRARGQSWNERFAHALARSVLLVLLGIFLQSNWSKHGTDWTFFAVLEQIGLGYWLVFLALPLPPAWQLAAALAILAGDWALFATYPLPGPGFDFRAVGVGPDWPRLTGFAAHWEKNANVAAAFDRWLLNKFPRPPGAPFRFNEGGYTTLNFLPSIATMLFGVLAGRWLRGPRPGPAKVGGLALAGAAALALGTALDLAGACPIVKRIWTPSWAISSAGWTCGMLATFYGVIDVWGLRRWSWPLAVVGVNSIAMYVMAQLLKPWVRHTYQVHLGRDVFAGPYGPIVESLAILFALWLVCLGMYRRRIFLKI